MPPRTLAVLILLGGACTRPTAAPTRPEPAAPPTADPAPTMTAAPNLVLAREQRAPLALGSTATIRYADLVVESLEPSPDGSYPAGSGVSLALIVEGGPEPLRRTVNLLSSGYTSQPVAWFDDHRVTLLAVQEPHRDARVELRVERVTGEVLPGAPVEVRVAAGGTVDLDAATRLEFRGHGTKSIAAGERPPLMIALRYHVAGEAPEAREFNAGADERGHTWDWRDRRFTVVAYAYDEWMQLRIQRLRLAPP